MDGHWTTGPEYSSSCFFIAFTHATYWTILSVGFPDLCVVTGGRQHFEESA